MEKVMKLSVGDMVNVKDVSILCLNDITTGKRAYDVEIVGKGFSLLFRNLSSLIKWLEAR